MGDGREVRGTAGDGAGVNGYELSWSEIDWLRGVAPLMLPDPCRMELLQAVRDGLAEVDAVTRWMLSLPVARRV